MGILAVGGRVSGLGLCLTSPASLSSVAFAAPPFRFVWDGREGRTLAFLGMRSFLWSPSVSLLDEGTGSHRNGLRQLSSLLGLFEVAWAQVCLVDSGGG